MLFTSRREQRDFFEVLYIQGLRSAKIRYGGELRIFNYQDAVHESIIYVYDRMTKKNFESLEHLRRYFWIVLKGKCQLMVKKRKEVSLNCTIGDSTTTLEDFIASRIIYPSLEAKENQEEIKAAVSRLPKEQRELVYWVWVDGRSLDEMGRNTEYLQLLLDRAKLKLARDLISKKPTQVRYGKNARGAG